MTAFVISGAALAASTATSAKPQSGQQIVDGAERTVRQIEADSRYDAILKQAKGVFIMPEVVKGAFIVGAELHHIVDTKIPRSSALSDRRCQIWNRGSQGDCSKHIPYSKFLGS